MSAPDAFIHELLLRDRVLDESLGLLEQVRLGRGAEEAGVRLRGLGSALGLGSTAGTSGLAGLLQGLIVAKLGLPPFIVTLAGLTGWRGLVFFITDEGNKHPTVPGQQFFETLGTGSFLGIGNPVWMG